MDFLWPSMLFLFAIIPALIGFYIWILRRRRRYTARFSSLELVRAALPRQSLLRRHLPFALFLLALGSLIAALARPVAIVTLPADQKSIVLTMDVSLSMRSNDIAPSRIEAAEAAAQAFIQRQKAGTQIGLVAFSGFAEIVQPLTGNQEALSMAVESLTLGRRTAIGSGILKALDAIAEVDPNVAPASRPSSTEPAPAPVARGAYAPAIIVLLTDGVSNFGPPPLEAAQQAVDRGVRVYTIGYGTDSGTVQFGGPGVGGGGGGGRDPGFGGGGGGGGFGGRFRVGIDEDTLKKVAEMTGGTYYQATNADELDKIFRELPTNIITKHETSEISVFFTLFGALMAAAALILSFIWHPNL